MSSRKTFIALFLLLIPLLSSAESVSLILGQQYNFTFNSSQYAVAMVGIAKDTATFVVSGVLVSPGVNETKILDPSGKGRIGLTLNQIMPNSTVSIDISYGVTGRACNPIGEQCSGFNDCCVGRCIVGACAYPPTYNSSGTMNASLDVPENTTAGSVVILRMSGNDGTPIPNAVVNILTPSAERLVLTTNESGAGSYLAREEGNYSYVAYGYLLSSNKTTLSKPAPPPVQNPQQPQPYCGDGTCSNGETCSGCPQDCGACPVQQAPAAAPPKAEGYSSLLWVGLMFLTIMIILRVLIPIFVRD